MDITLPAFPQIVMPDGYFRENRVKKKQSVLFLQDGDKGFAQELANRLGKGNNIAGMFVADKSGQYDRSIIDR